MTSLLPWGKKSTTELAKTKPEVVPGDIVIHQGSPLAAPGRSGNAMVQVRTKEVTIAGKKHKVDPYQLIRLIKRVTQNIGEYKGMDDIYSSIVCGALRKARGDLVNVLESEFHIHWQVDKESGESIFYM